MNRISKKLKFYVPVIKLKGDKLKNFFKINYSLFPFLWTLTFFIGILESFTYAGYSFRHLFLPFQLLVVLSIFSGIISRLGPDVVEYENKNPSSTRIIFTINRLIIIPLVVSYILVNSLEAQNYHNYVFSVIHMQPSLYFWPTFMSIYLFLVSLRITKGDFVVRRIFLTNKSEFNIIKDGKIIILRVVMFVFAFNLFIVNLPIIANWMYERSKFIVSNPLASYDEKMRYGWGNFYDYMLFIKNNTPEDAVIMFPPMVNPWMDVGGGGLIRYFLYPRVLIQNMTDKYAPIDESAGYAMLAWGAGVCAPVENDCFGWPKEKIFAKSIIYKQKKSEFVERTLYNVVYDVNDSMNKGAWGLIEIKK